MRLPHPHLPRFRAPRLDRRALRRWSGRVLAAVVGLAVVVSIVYAFLPQQPLVEIAPVRRGDLVLEVVEDGETRVAERYAVSAPVGGELQRITLEAGDAVAAGQTVARILPSPSPLLDPTSRARSEAQLQAAIAARSRAAAEVERARASLREARREVERLRPLLEIGGIARRDVEQAETQVEVQAEQLEAAIAGREQAEAEVTAARAVLEREPAAQREAVEVRSPVSGRVLEVEQESEEVVVAGQPLLQLGDPGLLEVVVDLLSADAVRLEPGAPARIEQWGGDRPLPARVVRVEPSAETVVSALGVEEQRVDVILRIEAPPTAYPDLGDAYRVEARIAVERREDVVIVPEAAVFRRDETTAVFQLVDGRARLVPVRLGLRTGLAAEVLEGLVPGDLVIVHPSEAVEDGVRVDVAAVHDR